MSTNRANSVEFSSSLNSYYDLIEIVKKNFLDLGYDLQKLIDQAMYQFPKTSEFKFADKLQTEIEAIKEAYQNQFEELPKHLDDYLESISHRALTLSKTLKKIKKYPLKNIKAFLLKEAQEQGVEPKIIKKLIKKMGKAIIRLVVQYMLKLENQVLSSLCQKEFDSQRFEYWINQVGWKCINPEKHSKWLELVRIGMTAFYQDWVTFFKEDETLLRITEPFFDLVEKHINTLIKKEQINKITSSKQEIQTKEISFPTYIFKDNRSYLFFTYLMKEARTQDDVGYAFRMMAEKENPSLIVAKETVFRNWFNEKYENDIILNNPIKTYDRINNQHTKQKRYQSAKKEIEIALIA